MAELPKLDVTNPLPEPMRKLAFLKFEPKAPKSARRDEEDINFEFLYIVILFVYSSLLKTSAQCSNLPFFIGIEACIKLLPEFIARNNVALLFEDAVYFVPTVYPNLAELSIF